MLIILIAIIALIALILSIISITKGCDSFKNTDTDTIKLFHWNIHYNCFIEKNGNCDYKNNKNVKQKIMEKYFKDIDFANLIQFEENEVNNKKFKKFKLINPLIEHINCSNNCEYSSILQKCGKHNTPLNLVYNSKKWKLLGSSQNCVGANSTNVDSRPFIVGKFESTKNKQNVIIYVVCVYMQHPWDLDPQTTLLQIKKSLRTLNFVSDKDKLIFMSDTNLLGSEDNAQVFSDIEDRSNNMTLQQYFLNEYIAYELGINSKINQYSTSNKIKTCCNDSTGFKYDYDRIFTNFGKPPKFSTVVSKYDLETPKYTKDTQGKEVRTVTYTNEMHRPLIYEIYY